MEASISEKNIIKVGNNDDGEVYIDEMKYVSSKSLIIAKQGHAKKDAKISDEKTCHDLCMPVIPEKIRDKVGVLYTEIEIEYPLTEKTCPGFPEINFESTQKEDGVKDESVTLKSITKSEVTDITLSKDIVFDSKLDNVGYIYTAVPPDKNAEQKPPPAQKIYACPECSFTCSQRGHLNVHRRTHSGEKPFHCLECGFRFLRKSALNNHMATHTGLKPFSCSECDYICSRKGDLKLHSRIHTGEKPFSCTECTYKCSQKGTIKNHILTHTGEKPFSCSKCHYICSEKGSLRRHSRIHTK